MNTRLRPLFLLLCLAAAGGQPAGAQEKPAAPAPLAPAPAAAAVPAQATPTPVPAAPSATATTAAAPAAASDAQVEGYLFFAANDATAPAQEEKVTADAGLLVSLEGRLKKVFPYSHYHLIGKHTQKVFKEYESWVVPSKDLCLKIDSRGPADHEGVNVHLQLWQDTKVLVKSDSVLRKDKPIFLGGPDWRGGRLIFVVRLK
ncbi:MAG: hypothetical protein JWL81_89 [Verrucomicrobiales bacterium]|nr:hypothetical protein [Verrucomicrobiales bacterium]